MLLTFQATMYHLRAPVDTVVLGDGHFMQFCWSSAAPRYDPKGQASQLTAPKAEE